MRCTRLHLEDRCFLDDFVSQHYSYVRSVLPHIENERFPFTRKDYIVIPIVILAWAGRGP